MIIANAKEIDFWVFYHVQILGNTVEGIKGIVNGKLTNIKFKDKTTKDEISIEYIEG